MVDSHEFFQPLMQNFPLASSKLKEHSQEREMPKNSGF